MSETFAIALLIYRFFKIFTWGIKLMDKWA